MTEAQMREVVSSAMVTAWATAAPGIPLALENEARPSVDSFALLTITPTTSAQMTLGRAGIRRTRRDGWIVVKLWGPANAGSAGLAALADKVRVILEMVALPSPVAGEEPIVTFAGHTQPIGEDGRWSMSMVRVPCYWTETK